MSHIELAGTRGLAIVLHGRGASKEDLLPLGEILRAELGLSVVLPDAPRPWGPGFAWFERETRARDLPAARAIVAELIASRRIAREEVAVLGFSQGGVVSLDVGLNEPRLVGRVGCLSGYLARAEAPASVEAPPRVFMAHGTEDELIRVEEARASYLALVERAVAVSYSEYPIGHEISPDVVKDLVEFLR